MKQSKLLAIASISFSVCSLFFVFKGQLIFALGVIACAFVLQVFAELAD
jgi:hypothetical protein